MIKVFSNRMWDLIDKEVQIQRVASGFEFTEGPIWHPRDHHLLFSDIPGNVRFQYSLDGTTLEVRNPSEKCNGMTYDSNLNLLVCEHLSSSLVLEGEMDIERCWRPTLMGRSSIVQMMSVSDLMDPFIFLIRLMDACPGRGRSARRNWTFKVFSA